MTKDPLALPVANPEYGQTNYVFVRVHNRGSKAANNAEVKLYWANPGTNLSQPYWKTSGIKVDGVAGNTRTITVSVHSASGDGEAIAAAFEWLPPDPAQNTAEPGHFCLLQRVNGHTTGRVSLVARIVGTPAYIANRNPSSLEIHLPNCQWAKKISGHHKVPYDDLQLAIQRGYNGCRFCLPDYNKG
jgi:hypothetical protein